LKEETPDRILWITRFGRGYGPVVRQTAGWTIIMKLMRKATTFRTKKGYWRVP
jgi:hypothetical protein